MTKKSTTLVFIIKDGLQKIFHKMYFHVFYINYNLKKGNYFTYITILWSASSCYTQHNTGSERLHPLCELHLHWFRVKLFYDFDYKSPKQHITNSIYQKVHSNHVFHKQIHINLCVHSYNHVQYIKEEDVPIYEHIHMWVMWPCVSNNVTYYGYVSHFTDIDTKSMVDIKYFTWIS